MLQGALAGSHLGLDLDPSTCIFFLNVFLLTPPRNHLQQQHGGRRPGQLPRRRGGQAPERLGREVGAQIGSRSCLAVSGRPHEGSRKRLCASRSHTRTHTPFLALTSTDRLSDCAARVPEGHGFFQSTACEEKGRVRTFCWPTPPWAKQKPRAVLLEGTGVWGERRVRVQSQLRANTFSLTVVVSRCGLKNVILSSPQFNHHRRLFPLRSALIPSPRALYNVSLARPAAFAFPRMYSEVSDSWIPVSCSYRDELRHTPRIRVLCQRFGLRKTAKTSY